MSSKTKSLKTHSVQHAASVQKPPQQVPSLLDAMQDGREFASLLEVRPQSLNLVDELRRSVGEIEAAMGHPVVVYVANVISPKPGSNTAIEHSDDLPFSEMIDAIPADQREVSVVVVSGGGSAQQVGQFVQRLRPRFDKVNYLIPNRCMSAGTIWVMSGDEIWMDSRAVIGPIDPQVVGRDGQYVPAQTVLSLIKRIQDDGQAKLAAGLQPNWTDIQLLNSLDPKEIGNAHAGSAYSTNMVAEYLEKYKFQHWDKHSTTGQPVTQAERHSRALEIAQQLCSHDEWKVHAHGITRDVAFQKLRLKVRHTEELPEMERALRRFWALMHWTFDNTTVWKLFLSKQYSLARLQIKSTP